MDSNDASIIDKLKIAFEKCGKVFDSSIYNSSLLNDTNEKKVIFIK